MKLLFESSLDFEAESSSVIDQAIHLIRNKDYSQSYLLIENLADDNIKISSIRKIVMELLQFNDIALAIRFIEHIQNKKILILSTQLIIKDLIEINIENAIDFLKLFPFCQNLYDHYYFGSYYLYKKHTLDKVIYFIKTVPSIAFKEKLYFEMLNLLLAERKISEAVRFSDSYPNKDKISSLVVSSLIQEVNFGQFDAPYLFIEQIPNKELATHLHKTLAEHLINNYPKSYATLYSSLIEDEKVKNHLHQMILTKPNEEIAERIIPEVFTIRAYGSTAYILMLQNKIELAKNLLNFVKNEDLANKSRLYVFKTLLNEGQIDLAHLFYLQHDSSQNLESILLKCVGHITFKYNQEDIALEFSKNLPDKNLSNKCIEHVCLNLYKNKKKEKTLKSVLEIDDKKQKMETFYHLFIKSLSELDFEFNEKICKELKNLEMPINQLYAKAVIWLLKNKNLSTAIHYLKTNFQEEQSFSILYHTFVFLLDSNDVKSCFLLIDNSFTKNTKNHFFSFLFKNFIKNNRINELNQIIDSIENKIEKLELSLDVYIRLKSSSNNDFYYKFINSITDPELKKQSNKGILLHYLSSGEIENATNLVQNILDPKIAFKAVHSGIYNLIIQNKMENVVPFLSKFKKESVIKILSGTAIALSATNNDHFTIDLIKKLEHEKNLPLFRDVAIHVAKEYNIQAACKLVQKIDNIEDRLQILSCLPTEQSRLES